MNRREFLGTAAAVPASLRAQAEPELTPLFDGKTLNGWSIQEGPESAFYVDNGPHLPLWRELPTITYWVGPSVVGLPIVVRALMRHPLVMQSRARRRGAV